LEIEAERAGGFVFAVDHDEVVGTKLRGDGGGKLLRAKYGRKNLQAHVCCQQEAEASCGEPEVGDVRAVVAAQEPVGERAAEQRNSGEQQRALEGSHGSRVEIEEVAEAESVVAGVLAQQRSEIGVGGH